MTHTPLSKIGVNCRFKVHATNSAADHLGISRGVISEYLNRMEEEGIVKRDFNVDPKDSSRYLWQIEWNSLPPEIASRLKKK